MQNGFRARRRPGMFDNQARDGRHAYTFFVYTRQSVCVFSRRVHKGEFNNVAGKWRRVFRDSRL